MTLCKANGALSERLAKLHRFEDAFHAQRRLFDANNQRLDNRASARYYLLRVEHELTSVRAERDRALRQRQESEVLNRQLEQLNAELSRKMREIEELQARLKREAVHDPLTQLFNRRYLDSAMPGLHRLGRALEHAADARAGRSRLFQARQRPSRSPGRRQGAAADREAVRDVAATVGHRVALGRRGILHRVPRDRRRRRGDGARVARREAAHCSRSIGVEQIIGGFTFSAALAAHGPHGRTLDELVDSADRALYAAKGAGRDRVLVAQG